MAVTLGTVSFDPDTTHVRETLEEVGGRDARRIELTGMIVGEASLMDVEAALDAILDSASAEDYSAELSLRAGRRLWVRRNAFTREVSPDGPAGSFTLKLEARDPFEEGTVAVEAVKVVSASGESIVLGVGGNVFTRPVVIIEAVGELVNPAVSDGTRTMLYEGVVAAGEVLQFDGEAGQVTLEGVDVTPFTTGLLPRIYPGTETLTYTDDASSTHSATMRVQWRPRWW